MKLIKSVPTIIVTVVTLLVLGAAVLPGLRIKQYANDGNPPDDAAYIMEETTANKHILHSQLRFRMTNGLATVTYVNSLTNAGTNYSAELASNGVAVAAGPNISVATNSSGRTMVYTVTGAGSVSNLFITNGIGRARTLVPSTSLTVQIDVANGVSAYYWTNMVTNVVCQFTNMFVAGVTNRVIDFFFTGATNNGPNYTVTFTCPNPAGVDFRWGLFSVTNGATTFSVTNNTRFGASLTPWDTNVVEGYFSPVR